MSRDSDTRCLAVIPARGGSKRVPKKNIRPMLGVPLMARTIAAARDSGLFGRIVVSTDCEDTAAVAREHGAEVPFLRAAGLADDHTPVSAATLDVLERLDPEGQEFDHVCQLMANCPLRTADDVVDSHRQFVESGANSQISVVRYGWQNPWWAMERDDDYALRPLFAERLTQRSQDLPPLFCPTGAIWWARAASLRRHGTFHTDDRTGWEIDWRNGLDIDTEDDWELAALLLRLQSR
jgi:N-acylneuraminate cytidylyltransferase